MLDNKEWVRIDDSMIENVWVKSPYDNCEENELTEISLNPSWYQDNGTPQCECGIDMVYSHTNILVPQKIELESGYRSIIC